MAAERDNLDIHGIVLATSVLVLATIIVVILLQIVYFVASGRQHRAKVIEVPAREAAELRAAQREALAGYRWIDRERGRVAVPIERAMTLVLDENN